MTVAEATAALHTLIDRVGVVNHLVRLEQLLAGYVVASRKLCNRHV